MKNNEPNNVLEFKLNGLRKEKSAVKTLDQSAAEIDRANRNSRIISFLKSDAKTSASPVTAETNEFGEIYRRVLNSLHKINKIMADFKKT